ncbi:MAG: hypothetical protein ABJQ38_16760, partial [Flavobacteriaceae bacterium]
PLDEIHSIPVSKEENDTGIECISSRGKFPWMQILVLSILKRDIGEKSTFPRLQLWRLQRKTGMMDVKTLSDSDELGLDPGQVFFVFSKKSLWAEKSLFINLHIFIRHVNYRVRTDASLWKYI